MKEIVFTNSEANDLSYDCGHYPDFFPINIGDDFKLESRPELFVTIPTPRKVKIEITSFRGVCCGAVHYYATIKADGIKRQYYEDRNGTKQLVSVAGYICEEYNNLPRKKDIWGSFYEIEVGRPVTKADKDIDPQRWEGYEEDATTNAFNTAEEAEATARAIVAARFSDEWEVIVNNPYTRTK